MKNYFDLLGLPQSFVVNDAALHRAYLATQHQSHPDRQVGKSEAAKTHAIHRSMDANAAYHALKSPLTRVQHLLALNGIAINGEHDTIKPDASLLMEMMELRERAESAGSPDQRRALEQDIALDRSAALEHIATACAAADWQSTAHLAMRLRYLEKIAEELRIGAEADTL